MRKELIERIDFAVSVIDVCTLTKESTKCLLLDLKAALSKQEAQSVLPKSNIVTRHEDMSSAGFMRLFMQDDGDICILLFKESGEGRNAKMCDIEFCEPSSGGGRSRHTRKALIDLMVAMEKDNEERPETAMLEASKEAK